MSLNRTEQLLFDYIQNRPEERQHWEANVRTLEKAAADRHAAAVTLEGQLWRYYEERSGVAAPFLEIARREGIRRISLRNLAEYLLHIWSPVRIKRPTEGENPRPN
jgi:hypothetical protein